MSTATATAYRSNFAGRIAPVRSHKSPENKPFCGYRSTYSGRAHCIKDSVLLDPCAGSGHILCYMFDVLIKIYEDYGYTNREAVANIVTKNLWGLDIDERAAQLSYFAVMMKARQYDHRYFNRKNEDGELDVPQPHIYSIEESNGITSSMIDDMGGNLSKEEYEEAVKQMMQLVKETHNAKEYGSIIDITYCNWNLLRCFAVPKEEKGQLSFNIYEKKEVSEKLQKLINVGETLSQKYDVVVTNPPYMGSSGMNAVLSDFVKKWYADYKSDLFSAFIIHCTKMAKSEGYLSFLTPYVWMFIQSYEKLRTYIYNSRTIETLIQFEYSAFEEATVPICTFAIKNNYAKKRGCYLRLTDFRGGMEVQRKKALEAISNHHCGYYFEQSADNFSKIPGSPVAYWVSENLIKTFKAGILIGSISSVSEGIKTGDNNRFLRLWYEVNGNKFSFSADKKGYKWYPHHKGGEYRKWYGNLEWVINWEDDGFEIKSALNSSLQGQSMYFSEYASWSKISSKGNPLRYYSKNVLFDSGAPALSNEYIKLCIGLFNCKVGAYYLNIISPTLNLQVGDIKSVPLILKNELCIENKVDNCILISRDDWDSFETSWDFKRHPLIKHFKGFDLNTRKSETLLSSCYNVWASITEGRFQQLKSNEEELNRIFIDIYGLQDELTPEVEDKDITVRKADLSRDIRSLISYAVGCMFGRYSLKKEGLMFAGGKMEDIYKYHPESTDNNNLWNGKSYYYLEEDDFYISGDNIIPITDDEYFTDDIVNRFVEFIEKVYGKDTLEKNLKFIADALGGKGTPKGVIRNYFLNGFYTDHCKIYQKRPIYWLFDSGKKNSFKCLIYMHRYQPDTIARIRTDYIHHQQERYHIVIDGLTQQIMNASSREKAKLTKRLNTIKAQEIELAEYEEKIHHLADQMISIDLDDGVKANYQIFKDVLAKIK